MREEVIIGIGGVRGECWVLWIWEGWVKMVIRCMVVIGKGKRKVWILLGIGDGGVVRERLEVCLFIGIMGEGSYLLRVRGRGKGGKMFG